LAADSVLNITRNKENKTFKWLIFERNKVYYLYKVLEEVIEFSKEEVFELSIILIKKDGLREASALYVGFLFLKYICYLLDFMKANLVDKFNPSAFISLVKLLNLIKLFLVKNTRI
jgi:serine/threonine-protein kinase ULK/ATG1